jgi:DNA (cytosine-5)-methyltransferase 1
MFQRNVVAYAEGQPRKLEKALVLKDAISDLPHVSNDEDREKLPYESLPKTDFQRYIRSTKRGKLDLDSVVTVSFTTIV